MKVSISLLLKFVWIRKEAKMSVLRLLVQFVVDIIHGALFFEALIGPMATMGSRAITLSILLVFLGSIAAAWLLVSWIVALIIVVAWVFISAVALFIIMMRAMASVEEEGEWMYD